MMNPPEPVTLQAIQIIPVSALFHLPLNTHCDEV